MTALRTLGVAFTRLFVSNSTSSIPSDPAPTTTAPSGDGVFEMTRLDSTVANNGSLVIFGAGTAGNTGEVRVFLWHRVSGPGSSPPLYFPTQLLDLTVTLGGAVGVASENVLNTDKFCNTITASTNTTTASKDISSPATTNGIAKADFDLFGASHVQVLVGVTTMTSINALFKTF